MIAGTVHAVVLVALPLVTGWMCMRWSDGRPSWAKLLVAAFQGALIALATIVVTAHQCDAGQPIAQRLIPGLCLIAVLGWVERRRILVALGMTAVMFALCFHYSDVVHGPTYVGTADPPRSLATGASPLWHSWLTRLYRREEAPPRPSGMSTSPRISG